MPREITRIEVPDPEPMHQTPDGGAETQGAAYRLSAPAVATEPLTVTAPDGTALTWVPTELCYRDENGRMDYIVGSSPAGVHVRDREARYQRTFPVADDVFKAEAERVKHWVILHEPPRPPAEYLSGAIEFGVTGLVSGVTLPEGRHDEIEAGPFRLPRPVARDLTGREIEGYYEVAPTDGGQQLFVWFPADAILGAVYPVTVDPTVTTSGLVEATAAYGGRGVAIAPDGTIYALVRLNAGPYLAVYKSVDQGQTWQNTNLSPNLSGIYALYPVTAAIAVTSDGTLHLVYAYNASSGGRLVLRYQSYNGSWSADQTITSGGSENDVEFGYPALVADANDVLHLAYVTPGQVVYRYKQPGGGWSQSYLVFLDNVYDIRHPTIGLTGSGQVVVVWLVLQTKSSLKYAFWQGSAFSPAADVSVSSGSQDTPHLVTDGSGNLHLFFAEQGGPYNTYQIKHCTFNGSAWSSPAAVHEISEYNQLVPQAAARGSGLHLFWQGQDAGVTVVQIKYAVWTGGAWGAWQNLSPSVNPQRYPTVPPWVEHRLPVLWTEGNAAPYSVQAQTLMYNSPPDAPILGQRDNFDATQAEVFSWTFSDPDPSDTQSAYQLVIKRASDGATVYDTGKVASSAQQHTLPAGTLTNGVQYRWTVRTWDSFDAAGAYASEQSFLTSAKPIATITDPATDGATVSTSSYTIQWSMSDPESKGQLAYQVVLKDGGVNVVHDSGKVLSTTARAYTLQALQNNTSYTVELTVWDGDGVASAVATRTFTVQYTPPPTPDVTVEALEAWVRITIANNNAGAEIQATSNDVYRRKVGEAGNGIRIATGVPVDGVVYDYTVASGVAYEYRVVAVASSNGTTAASAWVQAPVLALTGAWIHDPADPGNTIRQFRVSAAQERGEEWAPAMEMLHPAGREHPIAEFGEQTDQRVRTAIIVLPDSLADLHALRRLAELRTVLCYRDSAGRRIFGVLGPLRILDERHGGYTVEIEIQAVDYEEAV